MMLVTTAMFMHHLHPDLGRQPDGEHGTEFIRRLHPDGEAPPYQQREQNNDQHRPYKAQLLADDGEDEVVLRLGQEQMLLPGIAQALPHQAAANRWRIGTAPSAMPGPGRRPPHTPYR